MQLNVMNRGCWCPYCGKQKLCKKESCKMCFNHSFASHEKAEFWSDKNIKKPREVFKSSGEKHLFNCACGHTFKTTLARICSGCWCPYCAIPSRLLCKNTKCKFCFKKSFASHELAKFWSFKNKRKPRDVLKNSNDKFIFVCDENHEFSASLNNVNHGRWCPICKKKGEKKLYEFLLESNYSIFREKRFEWCRNSKTNRHFPFDFKIKNGYKVLIELDGDQHFRQVRNWKFHTHSQARDLLKMKLANENGYSVIRITWDAVYNDRKNWREKLINAIETIEPSTRLYICTNNEYDVYQSGEIDESDLEDVEEELEDAESELEEEDDEEEDVEEEEEDVEEEEEDVEEEEEELEEEELEEEGLEEEELEEEELEEEE
jgi:very-short-patch-repair endonuclease